MATFSDYMLSKATFSDYMLSKATFSDVSAISWVIELYYILFHAKFSGIRLYRSVAFIDDEVNSIRQDMSLTNRS